MKVTEFFIILFATFYVCSLEDAVCSEIKNENTLHPFSVHVGSFTFHYQLMHLLIKTLSQFTLKLHTLKMSVMRI